MDPIKSILKQCFCFTCLITVGCSSVNKIPIPPIPTGQKKNSNASITISSTASGAVVCIGSNNTIHIGTTTQEAQPNKETKALDTSTPNNQHTKTPDGTPITITSTDPNGIVVVGANNTICNHMSTQQQEKEKEEKEIEQLEKRKEIEQLEERKAQEQLEKEKEIEKLEKRKEIEKLEKEKEVEKLEKELSKYYWAPLRNLSEKKELKKLEKELEKLEKELEKLRQKRKDL